MNLSKRIYNAINEGIYNVLSPDIADQNIDFNHDNINTKYDLYEYRTVDMGTDILWCEYNIGSFPGIKASDWYGGYYSWGETYEKETYVWETYKYYKRTNDEMTKYNLKDSENRIESRIKSEDDVACNILSELYRMPTVDEYMKLAESTRHDWVRDYNGIYGLNGMLLTAKNDNTLFFPAAGYYGEEDVDGLCRSGSLGILWTASFSPSYNIAASSFNFERGVASSSTSARYCGFPVRAVTDIKQKQDDL